MKKLKKTDSKSLRLDVQTIKVLANAKLELVQGGQVHTSFSCGNNLCTTH